MKPVDMVGSIILSLLVATGLNSVLQFAQQVSCLDDLANMVATPFMVCFTFILPALINPVIWEGRKVKLVALNFAHQLVTYVGMSAVLLIWI